MALALPVSTGSEPTPNRALTTTPTTTPTDEYPPGVIPLTTDAAGRIVVNKLALMWASMPYFMSQLRDEAGVQLAVAEHHEEWCDLVVHSPLLCLLAPRDHGKSWTVISYLLWRAWKHNRDPLTGELKPDLPDGKFEVLYFSDTIQQAGERFDTVRSLLTAEMNAWLFSDMLPDFRRGKMAAIRGVWAQRRIRFRNRFEMVARGYRTSTRGTHPNLIVLDDVLNDSNTLTQYQRDKVWKYFSGTIMPMNPEQIVVIGTAFHYDDLLHRLKPDRKKAPLVIRNQKARFTWRKYKSVDWETGEVLWPEKHGLEDLEGRRDADPLTFAREWQNDPRDDASSIFPNDLTEPAIKRGESIPFAAPVMKPSDFFLLEARDRPRPYIKEPGELLVLSSDHAMSGTVGADYCVVNVASYSTITQKRTLLWAARGKGWGQGDQINALRMACLMFPIDVGVMEHNAFQRWIKDELVPYPECVNIVGHNTGPEKQTLQEGVPSLVVSLSKGLWTIASGDRASMRFARVWQSEMNAFGWKDDKLQGVGEHDDCVMAFWLLERAVRTINTIMRLGPEEQYVGLSDVGIERVNPAGWDNPLAYRG